MSLTQFVKEAAARTPQGGAGGRACRDSRWGRWSWPVGGAVSPDWEPGGLSCPGRAPWGGSEVARSVWTPFHPLFLILLRQGREAKVW